MIFLALLIFNLNTLVQGGELPSDGITVVNSYITAEMFAFTGVLVVFSLCVCISVLVVMAIYKDNK